MSKLIALSADIYVNGRKITRTDADLSPGMASKPEQAIATLLRCLQTDLIDDPNPAGRLLQAELQISAEIATFKTGENA